jgi:hypothetical protein
MPAKPVSAGKPTFYLDTSTLSHAFDSLSLLSTHALAPFRPLVPWIQRVADEANLVVSHIHVSELSEWPDVKGAEALITWLDALPLVWARFPVAVSEIEDEHWLGVALGLNPPPVQPFAPSMLTAFRETSPALLDTPTLVAAWRQEQVYPAVAKRFKEGARYRAEQLHANRASYGWPRVPKAMLKAQAAQLKARRVAHLRERATAAHARLAEADWYSPSVPVEAAQDAFVQLASSCEFALPMSRVGDAMSDAFTATVANRQPSSRRFSATDSSYADMSHAYLGAAYCDTFTCDKTVSLWLGRGEVRRRLRLPPEVAWEGGQADAHTFVQRLMSTWP